MFLKFPTTSLNRSLLFILISFFLVGFSKAQGLERFLKDSMDVYVNREMERWQVPGMSVFVIKNGKVLLEKGYGIMEWGKTEKVDQHSLFMIGSNTKAFTGTALALMEKQGSCNLNDGVRKWIPDFNMKDQWVASHLTLTDILCHRIGLETFQGDFVYWGSDLNFQQCMEKFALMTPVYDFRTTWGYTNMGFIIAGACLEKIAGKKWENVIAENFFYPLEMNHSIAIYDPAKKYSSKIAIPHTLVDGKIIVRKIDPLSVFAPAGSIFSSAHDMGNWVITQLDSGRFKGNQIIPMEVIEKTRTPQSIEGRNINTKYKTHYSLYGLGWGLSDYMGKEIVSHTGGVDGFLSSVTMIPEENLGIVVLTNTDNNSLFYFLKNQLLEANFEFPYENLSLKRYNREIQIKNEFDRKQAAWRDTINSNPKQPVPLSAFAGKYMNEVYGEILVAEKGIELEVRFQHHPALRAKLENLGKSRFLCTYNDPLYGIRIFPFVIENKKVLSFTLSVADFLEFTTYEFVKQE